MGWKASKLAVVAGIAWIVTLVTMVSVAGSGLIAVSHAGPPTDVYTQTDPNDDCATLGFHGQTALEQSFSLDAESDVVVYFSFEVGLRNAHQEAEISFGLDGSSPPPEPEWGVSAPRSVNVEPYGVRQSNTLMWTFEHVAAGEHRVEAFARVVDRRGRPNPIAGMNGCAMTVFVAPVTG